MLSVELFVGISQVFPLVMVHVPFNSHSLLRGFIFSMLIFELILRLPVVSGNGWQRMMRLSLVKMGFIVLLLTLIMGRSLSVVKWLLGVMKVMSLGMGSTLSPKTTCNKTVAPTSGTATAVSIQLKNTLLLSVHQ